MRVALQHRHRLVREGLALVLGAEDGLEVVGAAVSDADLLALCEGAKPDVAVIEVDTGDWDACRLAAVLSRRQPFLRLVGVHQGARAEAARARRAGLSFVVGRDQGVGAIVSAVRASGERSPTPIVAPPPAHRRGVAPLTARETEVLTLVGEGWTSPEISARLLISRKTVDNHKQRIFEKLGVQNQVHAVAVAARRGLISSRTGSATDAAGISEASRIWPLAQ